LGEHTTITVENLHNNLLIRVVENLKRKVRFRKDQETVTEMYLLRRPSPPAPPVDEGGATLTGGGASFFTLEDPSSSKSKEKGSVDSVSILTFLHVTSKGSSSLTRLNEVFPHFVCRFLLKTLNQS
jgi:hypothetical protein